MCFYKHWGIQPNKNKSRVTSRINSKKNHVCSACRVKLLPGPFLCLFLLLGEYITSVYLIRSIPLSRMVDKSEVKR